MKKNGRNIRYCNLDLNTSKYDEKNSLINVLNDTLCQWENIYGTVPSEVNPELRFKGIIRRAYEQTGQRVVILVDEYDKPMLQAIGDEELQMNIATHSKPSTP